MPRSVHQILGLLGANDPSRISVYPLDDRRTAAGTDWSAVWCADFGRLTASVTTAEKDALVAAGADERH